jgi:hypothetical protein
MGIEDKIFKAVGDIVQCGLLGIKYVGQSGIMNPDG